MAKFKTKWERTRQMIDALNVTNIVTPKDFDTVSFKGSKTGAKSPMQDYLDRRAKDRLEDDREPSKAQLDKAKKQYKYYSTKINKLKNLEFLAEGFELLQPEAVAKLNPQDKRDYTNQLKLIDNIQRVQSYQKLQNKELELIWYINDNKLSKERIHKENIYEFLYTDREKGNKIIDAYNAQAPKDKKLTINERKFLSDVEKIKTQNIYRTDKATSAYVTQKFQSRNNNPELNADAKMRNMTRAYESRLIRNQDYFVKAKIVLLEVKKAGADKMVKMYDKWAKHFDYYLGFAYDYDSYGTGESVGWTLAYERLRELASEILGKPVKKITDSNYADGILYN